MEALSHLVKTGHVRVYAFVIMPNHIHLLWSLTGTCSLSQLKQTLHGYTAHRFLQALKSNNNPHIKAYIVNKRDRKYQFWKRRSFDIPTVSEPFFLQKRGYIHRNPVKARLVRKAHDYKYSSAKSYRCGVPEWEFLTLWEVDFAE